MSGAPLPGLQRTDQWLWFSRLAKSRTLAQALIERGKVRLNRVRIAKPSQTVKPGDVLTLSMGPYVRVYEVRGLATRRGPAADAAALYRELTDDKDRTTPADPNSTADSSAARSSPKPVKPLPQAIRLAGAGRPTKRERRQTERLKGRFGDG